MPFQSLRYSANAAVHSEIFPPQFPPPSSPAAPPSALRAAADVQESGNGHHQPRREEALSFWTAKLTRPNVLHHPVRGRAPREDRLGRRKCHGRRRGAGGWGLGAGEERR